MPHHKTLVSNFFLCILMLFLVSSCKHKQTKHQTDLDNLYAIKRTSQQKDSIAKQYEATALALLAQPNTLQHSALLDSLIDQLRWSNDKETFFKLIAIAKKKAIRQHDNNRLARIYEDIAVYYHDEQHLDSVYSYYLKAEQLYRKTEDTLALAENMYYQARLLYEVGFNAESEVKLYKALKVLQNIPENPIHIEANQLKTFYLSNYGEYKQSLTILETTLTILKADEGKYNILPQAKYNLALANLYGNIALTYNDLENLEQVEQSALAGLNYLKNDRSTQVFAHLNYTYHLVRYEQGKEPNIIPHLMESYKIYSQLNHPLYSIEISQSIANIYLELNQPEKSLEWLLKAYDLAESNNLPQLKKEVIEHLLTNHSEYKTKELIAELFDVSKTLDIEQNRTKESFAKVEYDTFILEQENESLKKTIYMIYLGAFIVIGSLVFFIILVRLRNKNRDLESTNSQKSKNEKILSLLIENNTIENNAILKERNRIAKDLHDGIINSIFTLRFNTQLIEIPNQELKGKLVDELQFLEQAVRDISHSFSKQNTFHNKSFENLLTELVNKQSNKNNTKFSFSLAQDVCLEHLTTLEKVNIYQIIQEAFQNVNKHAQASTCQLTVHLENDILLYTVQDNGVGIKKTVNRGIGLSNMKERAQLIHAELRIESSRKGGTTIQVLVPN